VEKYSRIVAREEIAKNDFNISPSRYIHTANGEELRPVEDILQELDEAEAEATQIDVSLRIILSKLTA
jgi:type I restriction enzyme M protein